MRAIKRLMASLALCAAALAVFASAASAKLAFFQSLSGNIGCLINGCWRRT